MTDRDDHRLVELLFDEVPPADEEAVRRALRHDEDAGAELDSLEATLKLIRSVPSVEPPAFLDAKVMAEARRAADAVDVGFWRRWRRRLTQPAVGLALAGSTAALAALVVLPFTAPAPREAVESAPIAPVIVTAEPKAAKEEAMLDRAAPRRPAPPPYDEFAALDDGEDLARGDGRVGHAERARSSSGKRSIGGRSVGASTESKARSSRSEVRAPVDTDPVAAAEPASGESRGAPTRLGLAESLVEAADQAERRGEVAEARRIFERALERVRDVPAEGTVLVRFAEFELRQANRRRAEALARRALRWPTHAKRARSIIEATAR